MVKLLRIFHFIISRVVKYPRRHVVYFINTYTYSDVRIAIWIVAIRQCLKKNSKKVRVVIISDDADGASGKKNCNSIFMCYVVHYIF